MGYVKHAGARWERIRKIVLSPTYLVCWLCRKPINKGLHHTHPMSKTVDMVIPISKGGDPYDIDNLRPAHRYCNTSRGNRTVTDVKEREWLDDEMYDV